MLNTHEERKIYMENLLSNLQPSSVFKYFEEISRIPRGSGNEEGISNYLKDFAIKNNFEVIQDEAWNIIIKKPASKGYENASPVILQGHIDMVNEKNNATVHDFDKDPLKLRIEDDMLYATGTTLGGDNGIAVAMTMAILTDDTLEHPPLEALFTSGEETGMVGAVALDMSKLSGRSLINLDSEEEGHLLVSCSGGVRINGKIPVDWVEPDTSLNTYTIEVSGLRGGHSGMDIDKGRGNANKILARILHDLNSNFRIQVSNVCGGSKSNAIPRESSCTILMSKDIIEKVRAKVNNWNETLNNEYRSSDPDVHIEFSESSKPDKVFSKQTQDNVISALILIPNGIQSMSMDIKGLVESSLNLGVLETTSENVCFECAIRSCVKSLKCAIKEQCNCLFTTLGGSFEATSDYPEWQYNPDSPLRDTFIKVYKKLYNKEPVIDAIHAGVECGLFKEKLPDLDMISLGPNLYDVHTPDEHLSISSVKRSYEYVCEVLKELK